MKHFDVWIAFFYHNVHELQTFKLVRFLWPNHVLILTPAT